MFNLGAISRARRFVLLGLLLSAGSTIGHAQTATTAAPPRNISDISAILDQEKPDPSRVAKNKAAADAAPPAGVALGQFYYGRAQARAALGRNEEAIADCRQAIALGGDFRTEVSRYMQLLAQQYRIAGNVKGAIEIELAIVKKIEETRAGKGLLFGNYYRIVSSYLTLGDLRQAEIYVNKNAALLAGIEVLAERRHVPLVLGSQCGERAGAPAARAGEIP